MGTASPRASKPTTPGATTATRDNMFAPTACVCVCPPACSCTYLYYQQLFQSLNLVCSRHNWAYKLVRSPKEPSQHSSACVGRLNNYEAYHPTPRTANARNSLRHATGGCSEHQPMREDKLGARHKRAPLNRDGKLWSLPRAPPLGANPHPWAKYRPMPPKLHQSCPGLTATQKKRPTAQTCKRRDPHTKAEHPDTHACVASAGRAQTPSPWGERRWPQAPAATKPQAQQTRAHDGVEQAATDMPWVTTCHIQHLCGARTSRRSTLAHWHKPKKPHRALQHDSHANRLAITPSLGNVRFHPFRSTCPERCVSNGPLAQTWPACLPMMNEQPSGKAIGTTCLLAVLPWPAP